MRSTSVPHAERQREPLVQLESGPSPCGSAGWLCAQVAGELGVPYLKAAQGTKRAYLEITLKIDDVNRHQALDARFPYERVGIKRPGVSHHAAAR